tara:strand:+ start:353 stop:457 length:105 start_codon:yes stop_codon:yes gene_type:complete
MLDFKTLMITVFAASVTYALAMVADYYFNIWAGV